MGNIHRQPCETAPDVPFCATPAPATAVVLALSSVVPDGRLSLHISKPFHLTLPSTGSPKAHRLSVGLHDDRLARFALASRRRDSAAIKSQSPTPCRRRSGVT